MQRAARAVHLVEEFKQLARLLIVFLRAGDLDAEIDQKSVCRLALHRDGDVFLGLSQVVQAEIAESQFSMDGDAAVSGLQCAAISLGCSVEISAVAFKETLLVDGLLDEAKSSKIPDSLGRVAKPFLFDQRLDTPYDGVGIVGTRLDGRLRRAEGSCIVLP